jgi:CBS domain-containing membrane protein
MILGAFVGLLVTGLVSRACLSPEHAVWLIAPMGASAVLVFGVPASPLAQPWSVVGGNTLSALVGMVCARVVPDVALAGAVAVATAIAVMLACRCLHPPGGASALYAVLSAPAVGAVGWRFAVCPVLVNSVLLTGIGLLFNHAAGRDYPARPTVGAEVSGVVEGCGRPCHNCSASGARDTTRTAG